MSASEQLRPNEVLERLEEKERAARERASAAEEQARIAAVARGEAEQRLARYGIQLAENLDEGAIEAELDAREAAVGQTEAEIVAELQDLTRRRRGLQAELQGCIAREAEVLQGLSEVETELEAASHACADSAREVIEFQKAEERARRAGRSSKETASRAARERERAEARIEQETEAEQLALRRAVAEEANLEQVSLERSIATRTALEQAALEEDALQRATAARAAAERAAAQRVATEKALERPALRAPAPVEASSQRAAEAERAAARRRRAAETQAREAARDAMPEPFMDAGEELPEGSESSVSTAPTTTEHWFPADDDAVASDLPLEWLETEESFELEEPRPARPQGQQVRVTAASWFNDETSEEAEAEEPLPPVAHVEESRAPDQAGSARRGRPHLELVRDDEPEESAELSEVDRDEIEWEAAEVEDQERRRAEAELDRMERSAAERDQSERRERRRLAQQVEAEMDRYEHAAQGPRDRDASSDSYSGLYAGQDYGWEVQAARGVQEKISQEKEAAREHSPEASIEQARASHQAAEALRGRNRSPNLEALQTRIAIVLIVVFAGLGAALLFLDRTPSEAPPGPVVQSPARAYEEPPVADLELSPERGSEVAPNPAVASGRQALPGTGSAKPESVSLRRDGPDVIPPEDLPAWRRYAVIVPDPGKPRIAVVIDDMGVDEPASRDVIALPAPLTLSFLPHAQRLRRQAEAGRKAGHELMAHIPMEPLDIRYDPGPNYLGDGMSASEIRKRLRRHLDLFDFGIVGMNNHMGSRFTQNEPGMMLVMSELLQRRMLFLDSRTIAKTVGAKKAAEFGIPYSIRDVFLDHMGTPEAKLEVSEIAEQLRRTEVLARRNGAAIAIGHPHPETIQALREWLPEVKKRGFTLVPVTAVVRYQAALRADAANSVADAQ